MRLSTFDDWARRHHGLLTFEASGLSRSAWRRALDAGTLELVHTGVARLHGTVATPEQRIAAAVLAGPPNGLASHRSAARLWGFPRPDNDPVDLIVPRSCGVRRLDGVVLHRPSDRDRLNPQRRHGIRCTSALRALADLGAVDPEGVTAAVGHALADRLASLEALEQIARQHGRKGRSGIPALRGAIDEWTIDAKPADSILEAAMQRLITDHGLPPVEFHPVIEGWEVDFRFVDTPILLECDGWAYHGLQRANFERDRHRDTTLTGAGWIVLRFTYRAITSRAGATAARINTNLRRWAHLPLPDAREARPGRVPPP